MNQPLVSVLMTVYNREKYLVKAIESVLASTYTNLELIISDDRSLDRSLEIAKKYAEKDSRVKVFINENNLGDYPNRNKAASYASGKYLKYVDADDYIYPWGLQLLVEMMEKFPDAGWGLCSLIQVMPEPYPFMLSPVEAYKHHFFGPGLFHKAPLSAIIKNDIFKAVHGFKELRMVGDYEMWHRLGMEYPVVLMPDGIVWSREHDSQEMIHYRKYLLQYEAIRLKYLNHPNCPLSKQDASMIIMKNKISNFRAIWTALIKLNLKTAADKVRIFNFYFGKQKFND